MLQEPNILLVASEPEVIAIMQHVFRGKAALTCVESIAEVGWSLSARQHHLLFWNCSIHDGQWTNVLAAVKRVHPDLPVIILSRTASDSEWVDVLEAGAFDLLGPPYTETKLLAVMEHAFASYQAHLGQQDIVKHRLAMSS